jgi:tRNA-binding EMAP/Myf-like protein
VGEDQPRQIASGLREHYTLDDMLNRLVVVVCNLKEAKLQGFVSNGMVLAAKNKDTNVVELVTPPASAKVGERLTLDVSTSQMASWPANAVKKHKVWETVSANLHTNSEGAACWISQPILSASGQCTVATNVNCPVA